ncbi:MAG: energy-coupling factor transporter transmembrane protein EcfT [Synergistaceae bacterium]|nr:energy-coupling factor transporter transmembrane protein EcfT [Synergistaceae bacterium]
MYFTNVNLGQYIPTGSFIHRLDPRAKLFSLLLIISAIFPSKGVIALGFWTALLVLAVHVSKISWRIVLRASRPVMFLVIFTLVFNMIAASWGGNLGRGIRTSFFMASRLLVLMMFAVLLPLTTAPLELADGLDALLSPLARVGFPAHESAMMIGMALRFIPLLMQETDKIMRAQLSRGARLDQGNIFQRVKAFFPVLIPLFIIIFRRADDIAVAMEARGYEGGEGRTRRKPLVWKMTDSLVLVMCAVISGVSFIL